MNSFQFRQGNYFILKSVQQIETVHLEILHDSESTDDSEIKPIPITEEWLAMFGFKKSKSSWRSSHASFGLEVFGRGKIFLQTSSRTMQIFWVHQLQNLYLEVTGEELFMMEKAF